MELLIPVGWALLIASMMLSLFLLSRVTEVPLPHHLVNSTHSSIKGLVILLTGTSGWRRFDQGLAEKLAAAGYPVLGLDTLRYFFKKRKSPAILAADLSKAIREQGLEGIDLVFIGHGKGADVLPFAVNLLEPSLKARVSLVTLLGVARLASFHLRLSDLMSGGRNGLFPLQVSPELKRMEVFSGLCVYGNRDRVSLGRNLKRVPAMEVREVQGGRVFTDGDMVAGLVLEKLAHLKAAASPVQSLTTESVRPVESPSATL
jgi:type IV secretory pathway VirJ component